MKRIRVLLIAAVLAFVFLLSSCVRQPKYVITDQKRLDQLGKAWKNRDKFPKLNQLDYHIPLYARYLKGVKICLDPGHGGDAHKPRYKRGPTDYREAVMNWRVANHLKGFLEQAGALVKLTRDGDEFVSLKDRVRIANEWGADIFISMHHNAASPSVNRTGTWFHLQPDFQPSNLDLARYIQHGVADAIRLPGVDGVPLKSDQLMYDTGFGVLRGLDMAACLCEASFFTNPYEEYRLKKDWYLKREAYGYFLGLARYAWGGLPRAILIHPAPGSSIVERNPLVKFRADTGYRNRKYWGSSKHWILSDSVMVKIDGEKIPADFDPKPGVISARVPESLSLGEHELEAGFRNHIGNYSHPKIYRFSVEKPVGKMTVSIYPESIPAGSGSMAMIRVRAWDEDGRPVPDGTVIELESSSGRFVEDSVKAENGEAVGYLFAPETPGGVTITSSCLGQSLSTSLEVE